LGSSATGQAEARSGMWQKALAIRALVLAAVPFLLWLRTLLGDPGFPAAKLPALHGSGAVAGGPLQTCQAWGFNPQLNTTTKARSRCMKVEYPVRKGDTWDVAAQAWHSFTIRKAVGKGCRGNLHVLAWFQSVDGNVVFAVPAVPQTSADAASGILTVHFSLADQAVYDVTVITLLWEIGEGEMEVRRVKQSPFKLRVRDAAGEHRAAAVAISGESCHVAGISERPQGGGGGGGFQGRWIRCSSACVEPCPRDGWIFAPWDCSHRIYSPAQAQALASPLARARGRPLWIAVVGNSVLRGILHSMVDLLCEGCDIFTDGQNNIPLEGSIVKCWGWFDIALGSIRISYQDWRLKGDRSDLALFRERLGQMLREGPDIIVLWVLNAELHLDFYFDFVSRNRKLMSVWQGRFVHLLPLIHLPPPRQPQDRNTRDHLGSYRDWLLARRSSLADDLLADIGDRDLLLDLNSMAWPFIFDMERMLATGTPVTHWHRYSEPGSKRGVKGAVAEMGAHILLALLLEKSGREPDGSGGAHGGWFPGARLMCVNCPTHACCPWLPPDPFPNHTLSVPWDKLRLASERTAYSCTRLGD